MCSTLNFPVSKIPCAKTSWRIPSSHSVGMRECRGVTGHIIRLKGVWTGKSRAERNTRATEKDRERGKELDAKSALQKMQRCVHQLQRQRAESDVDVRIAVMCSLVNSGAQLSFFFFLRLFIIPIKRPCAWKHARVAGNLWHKTK